ncbi:hypothetical protein CPC08DRAFT_729268 [Agrocybe pediades]|nr:hypothetical protein CPC08DRAFT_729268 [Agrocybe pediades]
MSGPEPFPPSVYRAIQNTRYAHIFFEHHQIRMGAFNSGQDCTFGMLSGISGRPPFIWPVVIPPCKAPFIHFFDSDEDTQKTIVDAYGLFSAGLSETFCNHFPHWQGWTGIMIPVLAQASVSVSSSILAMELRAVSSRLPPPSSTTSAYCSPSAAELLPMPFGGKFCLAVISQHLYTFIIPHLAFEMILSFLAVYRLLKVRKSLAQPMRLDGEGNGARLVNHLLQGSMIYFIAAYNQCHASVGSVYIACLLVWIMGSLELLEVPLAFMAVLPPVIANRLVLNIRTTKWHKRQSAYLASSSRFQISTQPSSFLTFIESSDDDAYLS